jgi:hypothetical protein
MKAGNLSLAQVNAAFNVLIDVNRLFAAVRTVRELFAHGLDFLAT